MTAGSIGYNKQEKSKLSYPRREERGIIIVNLHNHSWQAVYTYLSLHPQIAGGLMAERAQIRRE